MNNQITLTSLLKFAFPTIIMMILAGENGVAAITFIIYSQFLLTAFYIGFSIGISPIISYNYGANYHDNLNKIFKLSRSFILITSIIFIISFLLGKTIVNIFASAFFPLYLMVESQPLFLF